MSVCSQAVMCCDVGGCTATLTDKTPYDVKRQAMSAGWDETYVEADAHGPAFASHYCPQHRIEVVEL